MKLAMIYSQILAAWSSHIKLQRSVGKCKCDWADIFIRTGTLVILHQSPFLGKSEQGPAKSREGWGGWKAHLFQPHAVGSLWCHWGEGGNFKDREFWDSGPTATSATHWIGDFKANAFISLALRLLLGKRRDTDKSPVPSLYSLVGTIAWRVIMGYWHQSKTFKKRKCWKCNESLWLNLCVSIN